jgi:hypothetical protein
MSFLALKPYQTYMAQISPGEQLDGYTYNIQRFELCISSGQSIGSTTTRVVDNSIDQTVRSLRTLLRDKKYGIRGGGQDWSGL